MSAINGSSPRWLVLVVAAGLLAGCSGNRTDNEATALDFFKKGNTAFQKEDYRHAIRMYEQAASLDPRSAAIQYNLGLSHFQAQTYGDAVVAYSRALKLDPTMAEAHRNLALAEDRLFNLEAAQTHYNIYQAMVREREAKADAAKATEGAAAAAPAKPKPGQSAAQSAAKPGQQGIPAPVSQLRRIGKEANSNNEKPAKSGGDGKWWTQDSSSRTQ